MIRAEEEKTEDGNVINADMAGYIDFSVKMGLSAVPVDIVNNVTVETYSIQISLFYERSGFAAVLYINLVEENAGYTVSLYYYNESTGKPGESARPGQESSSP